MKEVTYLKIPFGTLKRLNNYAVNGFASGSDEAKTYWEDRIVTACSVLYDCGCLNANERAEVSLYFRTYVYFGRGVI